MSTKPCQGPRSFRVLHLVNTLDGPVTGELKEYSLDQCPEHKALSYAWEGIVRECPIYCEGRTLLVTKSCESALRRLLVGSFRRAIWVDSVCINQSDNQERSQQVTIMGETYRKAEQVRVWLGNATEGSDAAIAELNSLMKTRILGMAPGPFPQWRKDRFQKHLNDLQARDEQRRQKYPFGLLGEIYTRSWFRRIWVVQEVAMAQSNKVTFYCGRRLLRFEILSMAVDFSDLPDATPSQRHWYSYTGTLRKLKAAVEMKAEARPLPAGLTLTQLLFMTTTKAATMPADKIFGLYSIAKHLGWHLPVPDYDKPVSQVFMEATQLAIESDQTLEIFDFVARVQPSSIQGLPSWAVDFVQVPLGIIKRVNDYTASRDSTPFFWFDDKERKLTLTGKMIDLLSTCGPPLDWDLQHTIFNGVAPTPAMMRSAWSTILQWMYIVQKEHQRQGYNLKKGESLDQAFARTMFLDNPIDRNPAKVIRLLHSILRLQAPSSTTPDYFATPEFSYTLEHVLFSCVCKALAITKDRRLAMVPPAARVDDLTVIFAGSKVPSILRQQGEEFLLIGSAYVHGVMGGELWTGPDRDVQQFTLI